MILKEINFSTGPVALHQKVKEALIDDPISHRSKEFQFLLERLCSFYREEFLVNDVYFIAGSGTTANEAMLQQIKMSGKHGLILSNGEFGNRLIKQAVKNDILFTTYTTAPGNHFDYSKLEEVVNTGNIHWILFCHCETSTGLINDLQKITNICEKNNVLCFADCISSVGAFKIDLSKVAMATASSGKGLCAIAGIAIILANIAPVTNNKIPAPLDLNFYRSNGKVPFTLSSNLLAALFEGSKLKLTTESFNLIRETSCEIGQILQFNQVKTFHAKSHVFTIIANHPAEITWLTNAFTQHRIVISNKSEYLQKNNWLQVALFGIYTAEELCSGVRALKSFLPCKMHT